MLCTRPQRISHAIYPDPDSPASEVRFAFRKGKYRDMNPLPRPHVISKIVPTPLQAHYLP